MSVWTSKYAIMRDLSKAQGRVVPVDLNSNAVAVSANQKPPQLATEETEEEFYSKFACGDVEYSTAPDFSLIQKMLGMVKGDDDSSDTSINGDLIQISKLNNNTLSKPSEAKTQNNNKLIGDKPSHIKDNLKGVYPSLAGGDNHPKKKQRNVAVISLLAALEIKENSEPLKLLKPTDFMPSKAVTDSVKKVDEWFTNKENSVPTQKNIPSLTSFPMFKKKSVSEKPIKQPQKSVKPSASSCKNTEIFKPSSKADEYYQKYLEKSQLNDCIKKDIWKKAERLMKEADVKRAAKAAEVLEEAANTRTDQAIQESLTLPELPDVPNLSDLTDLPDLPESESSTKLDLVALPEERHKSSSEDEECIVCEMVRKHGYSIETGVTVVEA